MPGHPCQEAVRNNKTDCPPTTGTRHPHRRIQKPVHPAENSVAKHS